MHKHHHVASISTGEQSSTPVANSSQPMNFMYFLLMLVIFAMFWFFIVKPKVKKDGNTKLILNHLREHNASEKFKNTAMLEGLNGTALIAESGYMLFAIDGILYHRHVKNMMGFDVFKDKETQSVNGLQNAAIGGLLFGGVGAIIGSNLQKNQRYLNSLGIVLKFNDFDTPSFRFVLINQKTKTQDEIVRNAARDLENFVNKLEVLTHRQS